MASCARARSQDGGHRSTSSTGGAPGDNRRWHRHPVRSGRTRSKTTRSAKTLDRGRRHGPAAPARWVHHRRGIEPHGPPRRPAAGPHRLERPPGRAPAVPPVDRRVGPARALSVRPPLPPATAAAGDRARSAESTLACHARVMAAAIVCIVRVISGPDTNLGSAVRDIGPAETAGDLEGKRRDRWGSVGAGIGCGVGRGDINQPTPHQVLGDIGRPPGRCPGAFGLESRLRCGRRALGRIELAPASIRAPAPASRRRRRRARRRGRRRCRPRGRRARARARRVRLIMGASSGTRAGLGPAVWGVAAAGPPGDPSQPTSDGSPPASKARCVAAVVAAHHRGSP